MRNVLLAVLILQSTLCALRLVMLLDIMGGFIMALAIGLGWYGWHADMHITFICYWGILSLVNGAFDLVRLIDTQVKSRYPMFSSTLPAMPSPGGVPSSFALRMRNVLLAVLILQSTLCALRLVMLLDIMGGFIMAIAIGLGWYGWNQDMHITFICYWGLLSLVNGAFDLVRLIDTQVKSRDPMFSSAAPAMYNFTSAVELAIPLSALGGCILAWYLYQDATGSPSEIGYSVQAPREGRENARTSLNSSTAQSGFKTFGGQGNRLGGDV
jgi:hypothetical protein